MSEPDFKNLSLDELIDMQEKLKGFVNRRLENKKKEALTQIQSLVKQYELSFDEVTAAIRVTAKRGKAPALYRNPNNPRQTWSGKGEPPEWYKNAKDPEKLRIPDS